MDKRSYKMVTIYEVRVDGRLFEDTKNKERADWLNEHLPNFYPDFKVEVITKRKREYIR